jgi:hypothetical protein
MSLFLCLKPYAKICLSCRPSSLSHLKEEISDPFLVTLVARVRRRGDRPPSYVMVGGIYLVNMVRQGVLCLLVVKNGVGVAT